MGVAVSAPTPSIALEEVEAAFEAYAAICETAAGNPQLLSNDFFMAARDGAFARFMTRFNAMEDVG